ncbi:hypothetical protein VPH35_008950 [Triticum aestivum]
MTNFTFYCHGNFNIFFILCYCNGKFSFIAMANLVYCHGKIIYAGMANLVFIHVNKFLGMSWQIIVFLFVMPNLTCMDHEHFLIIKLGKVVVIFFVAQQKVGFLFVTSKNGNFNFTDIPKLPTMP